jgi:hypothetical protein
MVSNHSSKLISQKNIAFHIHKSLSYIFEILNVSIHLIFKLIEMIVIYCIKFNNQRNPIITTTTRKSVANLTKMYMSISHHLLSKSEFKHNNLSDHAFLFYMREVFSSAILFVGQVLNLFLWMIKIVTIQ